MKNGTKRTTRVRLLGLLVLVSMVVAACSGSEDSFSADEASVAEERAAYEAAEAGISEGAQATDDVAIAEPVIQPTDGSYPGYEARVIRDGRIDVRVEPGTFDATAAELRTIAADLGGYLSSGESRVEEQGDERYAVGWYSLRIPSDRFDDAAERVEALGERVSSSLSSQDVTEEYVDLESRLEYWRQQEAFYSSLMAEATTIEELVTVQTQMQEVLLTIEQIEGRLRYLESRTSFATLTVGVTEVPSDVAPVATTAKPGPIAEAFEVAGEVLLEMVAFLIIAGAVVLPLTIAGLLVWFLVRLFVGRRPPKVPAEG